jgi:hypothetical protein
MDGERIEDEVFVFAKALRKKCFKIPVLGYNP